MALWHLLLIGSAVVVGALFLLVLFEPSLTYRVTAVEEAVGSERFLELLGSIIKARLFGSSRVDVHSTGREIYESQLAAIDRASACRWLRR